MQAHAPRTCAHTPYPTPPTPPSPRQACAPSAPPSALAHAAYALARLDHRPPEAWMDALLGAAEACLDEWVPGGGGSRGSGQHPPGLNKSVPKCRGLLSGAAGGIGTTTGFARRRSQTPVSLRFNPGSHLLPFPRRRFGADALALLLFSVAALGYRPPATWLRACAARSASLLPASGPASVARTAWALATLTGGEGPAPQPWLDRWVRAG
jgi:hypothetical protein